jgi:hypothetical protein
MAANEQILGDLHTKVAEVLTGLLDGQSLPTGEQDDDGNEIVTVLAPSAAIITSAIQFLKNNNITCTPSKDNALGALVAAKEAREARRKAGVIDLDQAREQARFTSGLPG